MEGWFIYLVWADTYHVGHAATQQKASQPWLISNARP